MSEETITVLVAGTAVSDAAPTAAPLEIIGRTETGSDTITQVVTELPDVLVLDTHIDEPDARAVCRRVREWAPATRVLAVSAADDEQAYTTIVAGAAGVVASTVAADATGDAAIAVAHGESLLLPRMASRLLHDIDEWAERSADPLHPPPTLTATEREVLARLGEGMAPADIADSHAVSPRLVNLHAGYAVAKLQRYVLGTERLAAQS